MVAMTRADPPDPADVLAAVGLPAPTSHTRMAGFDAMVWRAETGGRTVALRLLRPGHRAERETAAVRLAGECGAPVPRIVAEGSWPGRAVVVSTWCAGAPVAERLMHDPGGLPAIARRFGRAQAALHSSAVPAGTALERQGPSPMMGYAIDEPIRDALAAAGALPAVLVHLDYQPFNVLDDGRRITGIVDWSNAAIADPRYDVARTRAVLALAPAIEPRVAPLLDGFVSGWSDGYAEVRPMPDDRELTPFLAWAGATQVGDWADRLAAGEAGDEIGVARDFAERWRARL